MCLLYFSPVYFFVCLCVFAIVLCPSVCLSRSRIMSKRIIVSSDFFHHHIAKSILAFPHQKSWPYSNRDPQTWASNAGTNRDSGQIAGDRSMTAGCASNNCDRWPCSLSHRRRRISEPLPAAWMNTPKRTQQNLTVCSSKSEAEVIIIRVTTLQTMWNSPTFLWRFASCLRGTRHVKCYSYHARTSFTVSGGGKTATVHDPKPYI